MTADPARASSGTAPKRAGADPEAAGHPRWRRWRKVVVPAVTVAILVGVFAGVLPRFADYSQAWSSIERMPVGYVLALVVAAAVNIAVGAWPLRAALPGLRYGPAFVVGQTSFAISNAVPAGGAIGLGVEVEMLESYGFGAGPAASAAAISSLFNVFATLVMPVVGLLALMISGGVAPRYVLIAVAGILVVAIAIGVFAVVLRSEDGARKVGRLADRLFRVPARRWGRRNLDITGKVLDFRSSVIGVIRTRWPAVIGSTLLPQFTSWSIVLLTLHGLQAGGHTSFKVSWPESLAAFSFAVIVSFIPVTAGGLGTVDAGLTGLLTAFGGTASQALAVDLVWRAATFVPQVVTGALTFLYWQVTGGRRRAAGR